MKQKSKRRSNISPEYRLPANVMHEEAWEDDGPNMKLARAFIVVLVLHIVAVAGLAAFNLFDDGGDKIGKETKLPENPASPVLDPEAGDTGAPPARVVMEGMRAVKVEKPMSTALFALDYGLKEEQFLEMNKHIPLVSGPLLPNETVYVPDAAVTRSTTEDLPVAPVVKPSVAAKLSDPPEEKQESTPEVAESTPPKQETKSSSKPPKPKPEAKAPPKPASKPGTHTVAKGENLYRISLKYGVTVQALQRANGIDDASLLFAGQVLKIPK